MWVLSGAIIFSAMILAVHLNEVKKQIEILNAYMHWYQQTQIEEQRKYEETLTQGREEPFA